MKQKEPFRFSQDQIFHSTAPSESNSARKVGVRFPMIASLLGFPQGLNTHECYQLGQCLIHRDNQSPAASTLFEPTDEELAHLLLLIAAEFEDDFHDLPSSTKFDNLDLDFLAHYWIRKIKEWRNRQQGLPLDAPRLFDYLTRRIKTLGIGDELKE